MTNELNNISATSVVALFDTDKTSRETFAQSVIQSIVEGNVNPLAIHVQIKCMEDIIKKITEDSTYKEALLTEADRYGGKTFEFHNAEIKKQEVGVKYDYSQCGSDDIDFLAANVEEAKTSLKNAETFYKNIPEEGKEVLQETTGEVKRVFPPAKTSTSSIVVKLK